MTLTVHLSLPTACYSEYYLKDPTQDRLPEVNHVVSLFENKAKSKQLLNLDRDQVQKYVDILDTVWHPMKWILQFI